MSSFTYETVHIYLRRDKGDPTALSCVECGQQAKEWAYNHTDPDELRDPKGRAYSMSAKFYQAMCRSCHRRMDNKDSCRKGHEFTSENTYLYRGYRLCRKCRAQNQRDYREKESEK